MIEGFYFDPWHGGCLRRIVKVGENSYKVHGVYGNDDVVDIPKNVEYNAESSSKTHMYWHASINVVQKKKNSLHLKVYFGGKLDKARLTYDAVYDMNKRLIKWDDSNEWKKMYYHKKQFVC